MDDAGAGVERDVIAEVDRRQAVIAGVTVGERMLEIQQRQGFADGRGNDRAFHAVALQAGFHEVLRQDQQQRFAIARGLHQRIREFRMHVQRLVRRNRPRRRGPDDGITFISRQARQTECFRNPVLLDECKTDIDGRVALVLVFDFRFGQRRAAIEAPVHRLQAAIDIAFVKDRPERADFIGFVTEVHGLVRIVPFAKHAEPHEVLLLPLDLLFRVSARLAQYFIGRQAFAMQLFDLDFNRHAVAIPARHIRRIKAVELARLDDHVFQDLVDGMADVDVGVRIRRSVMQDEFWPAFGRLADLVVDFLVLPFLDPFRLALGQVAAHRERGFSQVDRIFILRVGHR